MSLAAPGEGDDVDAADRDLSEDGADYLATIATDGTLRAALAEIAATEPELAN